MDGNHRLPPEAWIPLAAGLYWLWHAPAHGLAGFAASLLPGTLLLGAGVAMLLYPGDRRISQFAALGGVLGVLFALPAFWVMGVIHGLLLVGLSVASYLAAGFHALRGEPEVEEVPAPQPGLALAAQVGVDEVLLATMLVTMPLPNRRDYPRIELEATAASELFEAKGWLDKPADYHREPPPLEAPLLRDARVGRLRFEHLSFESEYEPHPEEPGRERWLAYSPNRVGHAWVLRAPGPGPWLVCIHGYQMGQPRFDLAAFPPRRFHERQGFNLLVPTLPLHGLRKVGRRSGDRFLAGDLLDTIHAEAQAMWDLRRLVGWARSQGATAVGVLGYSLGGYNAALLACLAPDLACAIAGIPATCFTRLFFRHGPLLTLRHAQERGMEADRMAEIFRVISPLDLPPRVPRERRYIFAAVADRWCPSDQVRDLWRHWERPAIEWYQGSHVSFHAHPQVQRFLSGALRDSFRSD